MNVDCIIVDGKYFCHRFFGRKLTSEINGKIVRTDIPYGCLTGLISFYTAYKPKYGFIISWDDSGDDLEKKKIDKTYKDNRSPQETTFYDQLQLFMKILQFLGVPQFIDSDWESDDIMGSLVKKRKDLNFLIHTSDKDLYQVISKNTSLLKPIYKNGKKKFYGIYGLKELKEELDITPKEYYLMKMITGCKGDNVLGVKGIGEKTAIRLVKGCNNIQDILDKSIDVGGNTQTKILDNVNILEMNKKLVKIKRNIKLKPIAKFKIFTEKRIINYMKRLRFNSMLRTYNLKCLIDINQCASKAYNYKIWRVK